MNMPGWLPHVETVGSSLMGGALVAVVVEMLWRPRRDRKRAARILLRELTLNRAELTRAAAQVDLAAAGQRTVAFSFSTVGLGSVGSGSE
jgi:hypothetical protein